MKVLQQVADPCKCVDHAALFHGFTTDERLQICIEFICALSAVMKQSGQITCFAQSDGSKARLRQFCRCT